MKFQFQFSNIMVDKAWVHLSRYLIRLFLLLFDMFQYVLRDLTLFIFVLLFMLHCRVDPAYERGASNFVRDVAGGLGRTDMIVCPCIDCRNIDRHSGAVVVDHLVTRGMD